MPQFRVFMQQFVEEIAELEIEAASAEEARDIAQALHRQGDIDEWRDGGEVIPGAAAKVAEAVYLVEDSDGNEAWERL
jgi:hypothetical protein